MTNIITSINQAAGKVIKLANGGVEQHFRFGKDFTGFTGHFPGNPVLPAFVQICMSRLLWTACSKGQFIVKSAKFMQPIGPDEEIIVRVQGNEIRFLVSGKAAAIIRVES